MLTNKRYKYAAGNGTDTSFHMQNVFPVTNVLRLTCSTTTLS